MRVQLDDQRPLLAPPGEGEIVTDRPERTLRILGELDELIVTWFRYAARRERARAARPPPAHRRLLRARGRARVALGADGTALTALPGMFAAAPPNVVHTFRNASDATAVFLNLHVAVAGLRRLHPRPRSTASTSTTRRPTAAARSPTRSSPGPDEAETLENERQHAPDPLRPAAADRDRPDLPAGVRGRRPAHPRRPRRRLLRARGRVRVPCRRRAARRGPGTFVAAPPDTVHGFRNAGPEPIRFLNLHAPPAGFLDRLRACRRASHPPRWLNQRPTSSSRKTTACSPPASTTSK